MRNNLEGNGSEDEVELLEIPKRPKNSSGKIFSHSASPKGVQTRDENRQQNRAAIMNRELPFKSPPSNRFCRNYITKILGPLTCFFTKAIFSEHSFRR